MINGIDWTGEDVGQTTLTTVDGEEAAADRCPRCRGVIDSPTTREQLELRTNLPVPPTAFVQQIVLEGRKDDTKFEGLSVHLFGVRVRGIPADPPYPALIFEPNIGGPPWEFLLVLRLVNFDDPPVTMRVRWQPDRGELPLEIIGWEACLGKGEWGRLAVGANLLHEYGRLNRQGRPPGSTNWDDRELRERLTQVRKSWFERHGRPPTIGELAVEVGMSKSTLDRHLSRERGIKNN